MYINKDLSYGWVRRHYSLVIIPLLISIDIYLIIFGESESLGQIFWQMLTVNIFLIGAAVYGYIFRRCRLRHIQILEDGLWANVYKCKNEAGYFLNVRFIKWSEVKGIEKFQMPDMDSYALDGLSGIRLVLKEGCVVVYSIIHDYQWFLDFLVNDKKIPILSLVD